MIDSIKQKLEKLNPIEPTSLKKAGVFIGILYHDEFIENPEIIFTQRSTRVSTHSGEVSFPGGKWEEGDSNLYETSLRESNEEINLNIDDVQYLGSLHYLVSKHKIEVNPYIGLITKKQNFIDNAEIAHTFTVPLDFLLNNGGSAFLPSNFVAPYLVSKQLYEVKDAISIERNVYGAYWSGNERSLAIEKALLILKGAMPSHPN